jgi:hypothetical protein
MDQILVLQIHKQNDQNIIFQEIHHFKLKNVQNLNIDPLVWSNLVNEEDAHDPRCCRNRTRTVDPKHSSAKVCRQFETLNWIYGSVGIGMCTYNKFEIIFRSRSVAYLPMYIIQFIKIFWVRYFSFQHRYKQCKLNKPLKHNSNVMISLKTLYSGGIRTLVFLRCPLSPAARASSIF